MIGTFSQGLCDSGKRHWPTTCDIVVTIFVIDCRIDRVLGTPLSRISHDLCTSLIVRLSYPFPISHGLHTSSSQCQTCAACIEYRLHISKMDLVVEWLYQPWLVHISHLSSMLTACITLDSQTLVMRHRVLLYLIFFGVHIVMSTSSLTFLYHI